MNYLKLILNVYYTVWNLVLVFIENKYQKADNLLPRKSMYHPNAFRFSHMCMDFLKSICIYSYLS